MGNRTIVEINPNTLGDWHSLAGVQIVQWLLHVSSNDDGDSKSEQMRDNLRRCGITILAHRHSTDAVSVNVNGKLAWSENTEEKVDE